jgi:tetratricopeptide (TPR) repeat protein
MMYGKQGKVQESLEALATGEKLNPNYEMIFVYRGNDYFTLGEYAKAAEEFKRAVAINPLNQGAANGLQLAQKQLRAKQ